MKNKTCWRFPKNGGTVISDNTIFLRFFYFGFCLIYKVLFVFFDFSRNQFLSLYSTALNAAYPLLFAYTFFEEVLREIFVERSIKRFDWAKKSIRFKESDPVSLSKFQDVKHILMWRFLFFYLAPRLPFNHSIVFLWIKRILRDAYFVEHLWTAASKI